MSQPELALLVSTFQRPAHLRRVLAAIAVQQGVAGKFEVVITDDGSQDETPEIVREFAAGVDFPVQLTTHSHEGFQLARCRNEGVAASRAPYLLFLDGDCLIPPDHLRTHLARRRAGFALAAYCVNLERLPTESLTEEGVRQGRYRDLVLFRRRLRLHYRHWQAQFYSLIRDAKRPKLPGGNIGISRADYERINGYDENFRGWGCEDDDLRLRLRAAGIRVASISSATNTFHMWHPKSPSTPVKWREGENVNYLRRAVRLTRCLAGLTKRRLEDVRVNIIGGAEARELAELWLPRWCRAASARFEGGSAPEIEFAFAGGAEPFSTLADCRILIAPPGHQAQGRLLRQANLVFAMNSEKHLPPGTFELNEIDRIIAEQLGFREAAPALPRQALQFA